MEALQTTRAHVILGPRTNSKTAALGITVPLPPALPGLDATVNRVETVRHDMPLAVARFQRFMSDLEDRAATASKSSN